MTWLLIIIIIIIVYSFQWNQTYMQNNKIKSMIQAESLLLHFMCNTSTQIEVLIIEVYSKPVMTERAGTLPYYIWNECNIANYQYAVAHRLNNLLASLDSFNCIFPCNHSEHKCSLSLLCNSLALLLKEAAVCCVDIKPSGFKKPYWSSELSYLKRLSVEAHSLWVAQGRPRSGLSNDNRLLCKARYKHVIRAARCNFEHKLSNKLTSRLLEGNSKSFWSLWNSEFGAKCCDNVVINGISDASGIAQGFANHFANNFCDSASNVRLKRQFMKCYETYAVNAVHCELFSLAEVCHAVTRL
jgi:hypothetical protein